ncbi:hypothetical protein [Streptomyces sp. NPDC001604]|uniref:hypothetical protein n=1 Tax=Streptomyces sp. NPDC001604 TaxID=3364593 RepID=UPI00367A157F
MQDAARGERLWTGHARIDAHVVDDTGSELTVHLGRHAPEPLPQPDQTLLTRFLTTVTPRPTDSGHGAGTLPRAALTSPAVAAWVGASEAPELVVDRFMAQLPYARTAGALIDESTCRIGLRSALAPPDDDRGMLLTMTSETPSPPVELFPSLLYSWLQWSYREANPSYGRQQTALPPRSGNLDDYAAQLAGWLEMAMQQHRDRPAVPPVEPVRPFHVNLVEDGQLFRVRVHDFDHTRWPDQPARHRGGLSPE